MNINRADCRNIAEKLIASLNKGTVEWEKAWESTLINKGFPKNELDDVLERYFKAEKITFREVQDDGSYYSPSDDEIVLPYRMQFKTVAGYYATKAHEAVHSTGSYIRCYRESFDERRCYGFGSTKYSREELVAELGACFLLKTFGINTEQTERNALAYTQSWLQKLQGNPRWVRKATEEAIEAVEYILERAETVPPEPRKPEPRKPAAKKPKAKKPTAKPKETYYEFTVEYENGTKLKGYAVSDKSPDEVGFAIADKYFGKFALTLKPLKGMPNVNSDYIMPV